MAPRIIEHNSPAAAAAPFYYDDDKHYEIYKVWVDGNTEIETLVTHSPGMVDNWITNIERVNRCRLHRLIVGLNVERGPNFSRGANNPIATLQLCVGKSCLIFQILHSPCFPQPLIDFLKLPDCTFMGVGVKENVHLLQRHYGLQVENTMELAPLAASELGKDELGQAELLVLAREILGVQMIKPRDVISSRWDKPKLTLTQVSYACIDAYMSFEIGRRLLSWF